MDQHDTELIPKTSSENSLKQFQALGWQRQQGVYTAYGTQAGIETWYCYMDQTHGQATPDRNWTLGEAQTAHSMELLVAFLKSASILRAGDRCVQEMFFWSLAWGN